MKADRVIITSALRLDILGKIATGHQGIQKCQERAAKLCMVRRLCLTLAGWKTDGLKTCQ